MTKIEPALDRLHTALEKLGAGLHQSRRNEDAARAGVLSHGAQHAAAVRARDKEAGNGHAEVAHSGEAEARDGERKLRG